MLSQLDDAGVSTGTIVELRGDVVEQLLNDLLSRKFLLFVNQPAIAHQRDDAPAIRQRAGARQRDELLCKALHFLGLGWGGADLAVLEQALHQVSPQRNAMFCIATQLPAA